MIMLGVSQYVQDYDGRYPLSTTANLDPGWAHNVLPYLPATTIIQCPADETAPKTNSSVASLTHTNYWFNARLSGIVGKRILNQSKTISFGDGLDTAHTNYHLSQIPAPWRRDDQSPLFRHLGGANFAFADGHVKWFSADKWQNELTMKGGSTFRLNPK